MKNFKQLLSSIVQTHQHLQSRAVNAVNQALTIRNWLIGYYIVEFEQNGKDRAKYGERLMDSLADKLKTIKGIDRRSLFRYRTFYLMYPHMRSYLLKTDMVKTLTQNLKGKVGTLTPLSLDNEIVDTPSPQLKSELLVPAEEIITKLSYSHIEMLLRIDDALKRTFYEIECIKGTWSVRELKRQISSLYYERSGLSAKPDELAKLVHQKTKPQTPPDIIKNIYAFEFLDLKIRDVIEESDLETALLSHLQEFILELGNGFCLEARQKRILIGETYYFIDLVFYHRLLKCHVLIDLKIGAFEHGDIGQLNTYINFFKENITEETDNLPVGILLVAEKDQALVQYATAGMDKNLFVQKYLVKLPGKEQLENYINQELKRLR
ncbi:MAG TPA: PDDEXK nuclease domain-containing protein [Flavobacteriaceae bacterium]|nr:PDDEXK nuclease domain-containing protein [Flavobacteriaceae bacterium]